MGIKFVPIYILLFTVFHEINLNMNKNGVGSISKSSNDMLIKLSLPTSFISNHLVFWIILAWALIKANTFNVIAFWGGAIIILGVLRIGKDKIYFWFLNPSKNRVIYGPIIGIVLGYAACIVGLILLYILYNAE
jgi:hypothetical protein